ncbi:MAG: zeta toxin family protein [Caulobacter sp.]|nr:zeta toxin family protein [Caulobacter sp.]
MPTVLIIAGPNGAGKTTFATRWIAENAPSVAFVNADEVARGLDDPSLSTAERDMKAGRLTLARLDALIAAGADLVLETTLSSGLYARRIPGWKAKGYEVSLIYLRLPNVEASIARVARRVSRGGHDVPEVDLRRRFGRSLANLELFKPLVDDWEVWDNSADQPALVERSAS